MTSAHSCSMSRRDHLARLFVGALSPRVALPKRKASSPRDVAAEFTGPATRQELHIAFPHCYPFTRLRAFTHVHILSCSSFHPLNDHFRPVFPTFLHFFHLLFAALLPHAWRHQSPSLLPRAPLLPSLFRSLASLPSSTQVLAITNSNLQLFETTLSHSAEKHWLRLDRAAARRSLTIAALVFWFGDATDFLTVGRSCW
jgi:hypothetical protein